MPSWPASGGYSPRPARRGPDASRCTRRRRTRRRHSPPLPGYPVIAKYKVDVQTDGWRLVPAADGALKSMMGPVERVAMLFGWPAPGLAEEVGQTIDYVNSELKRLQP